MELVNVIVPVWKLLLKKIKEYNVLKYNIDNFARVLTKLKGHIYLLMCCMNIVFIDNLISLNRIFPITT